ncbi:DsbA family protein [uncultured Nocardioides sp.]|uniref:DsbA family protein n=1 Tax=uncultured Nocardioides sp. TaxID=198441 RepID=UPI00260EDF5B|nr:DsbA family protein [uncultured Nocardioides sp.]
MANRPSGKTTPKGSGASTKGGSAARAAAVREEQQRREKRRVLVMAGSVAAVVLALIVGAVLVVSNSGVDADEVQAGSSDYGLTIGPEDAPTEIVVFEDFLCPACGAFESETNTELAQAAADGDVRVEYRPFVLLDGFEDYSSRAVNAFAVVLEESGPEVAKAFHDELYADQPSESDTSFPDADWLVEKAVAAGAEEDAVRPGIEDMAQQDFVEQATSEAQSAGVSSTPTVIVDGEVVGGQTMDEVAQNTLDQIG